MKDLKLIHILIVLSIFSSCLSLSSDIKFIIDASLNGTCALAFLNSVKTDEIFFSYDFEFHSNFTKMKKDYASFEITSIGNNLLEKYPLY